MQRWMTATSNDKQYAVCVLQVNHYTDTETKKQSWAASCPLSTYIISHYKISHCRVNHPSIFVDARNHIVMKIPHLHANSNYLEILSESVFSLRHIIACFSSQSLKHGTPKKKKASIYKPENAAEISIHCRQRKPSTPFNEMHMMSKSRFCAWSWCLRDNIKHWNIGKNVI